MRRKGYTMRPKTKDTAPPIIVLLTRQERWTRAEERWKCQQRRFARRRAPLSVAPTLDAIPAAVPYKDLTPAERERQATTATPEERVLLYPAMHAFRQSMKPQTTLGAWVYRVLLTLMLVGGLVMAGYGLVVACTHPNVQDAEGFIFGGAVVASASFQFAAGLAAWDEERQGSTDRDLAPR